MEDKKGYILDGDVIIIQRELTELDLFLKRFLSILTKYSDYLVVSGYVSICSGRTRATEDIDILFPVSDKEKFETLFRDLKEKEFWCYQGEEFDEVYSYLKAMESIRFAEKEKIFPNIEFIPINESKSVKWFEFTHPQKIRIRDFEFKIPPIEFEIVYKELILRGEKDVADARHLRTFFSDIINEKKFKEYESVIKRELK